MANLITSLVTAAAAMLRRDVKNIWIRSYSGKAAHVAIARDWAYSQFWGTGREDDVKYIVSELATNAIKYTASGDPGGFFALTLAQYGSTIRIEVADQGGGRGYPGIQPQRAPEDLDERGRGLRSVADLSANFGINGNPTEGHVVWVDLDLRTPSEKWAAGPGIDQVARMCL